MHFIPIQKREFLSLLALLLLAFLFIYESIQFYHTRQPAKIIVTPELSRLDIGKKIKLKVTVLNQKGEKIRAKVNFSSSNEDVLTVNPSGVIKAISEGSSRLKVSSGKIEKEYWIKVGPPFEVKGYLNSPQTNGVIVLEVTKFIYDEEKNLADILVWIKNAQRELYEVKPEQFFLIDNENEVYILSKELTQKRADSFKRKKVRREDYYAGIISFKLKRGRKPLKLKFDDGINYPLLIILEKPQRRFRQRAK